MATQAEIEAAVAEDALSGIAEAEDDMGKVKLMSSTERLAVAAAVATSQSGSNPWGNVLRARALPVWNE